MTKPTPPDEIDALLSDGRLGGPARERILNRVLDAVEPHRPSRRTLVRRALLGLIPLGAACAVFAFIFLSPSRPAVSPGPGGELRAKGSTAPAQPSIDPLCDGEVGVCSRGQRLYFRADAVPAPRWLVAYAEAVDSAPTVGRLWMFPEENQVAPKIPTADEPSILRQAIELGNDLRPGRYRLTMILFDHPVGRVEASDPGAGGIRIVRSLVIR
jgi:hypothetical protein